MAFVRVIMCVWVRRAFLLSFLGCGDQSGWKPRPNIRRLRLGEESRCPCLLPGRFQSVLDSMLHDSHRFKKTEQISAQIKRVTFDKVSSCFIVFFFFLYK